MDWPVQRSRILFGESEASLGLVEGDSSVYRFIVGGRRGRPVDNRVLVDNSMSGT